RRRYGILCCSSSLATYSAVILFPDPGRPSTKIILVPSIVAYTAQPRRIVSHGCYFDKPALSVEIGDLRLPGGQATRPGRPRASVLRDGVKLVKQDLGFENQYRGLELGDPLALEGRRIQERLHARRQRVAGIGE